MACNRAPDLCVPGADVLPVLHARADRGALDPDQV